MTVSGAFIKPIYQSGKDGKSNGKLLLFGHEDFARQHILNKNKGTYFIQPVYTDE